MRELSIVIAVASASAATAIAASGGTIHPIVLTVLTLTLIAILHTTDALGE